MNNKGQTLILFVIMLPILLIILTLVIDLGFLYIEKRNISNNVKDSIKYYLDNEYDLDIALKTERLLNENIEDIEKIIINNQASYVEITVIKNKKGLYSNILKNYKIEITYKGYKNDKKVIKG